MVSVYCLTDINGKNYVGTTKQTLKSRHRDHRKNGNKSSSQELDVKNTTITLLETCNESNRRERESYWINKIDCVNIYKLDKTLDNPKCIARKKKYDKEWKERNRERVRKLDTINSRKRYNYQKTWGGALDSRRQNDNNLLMIDPNLFL